MASVEKHSVLRTEKLSVGYAEKKRKNVIASNISIAFSEGELIGLVGANGIGKSTLLRTLAGMQAPLDGDVLIQNKIISEIHPVELATLLSVVLTEPPASKNLTVRELVSLGRQPYTNWIGTLAREDETVIENALSVTETALLQHRKCFELSDGQLQRAYIARALAQDTPLILLDEPTTHLDIYHRAYVLKLLKKLASETKKTVLFSTHEIDLAIQLADKMLVMTSEKLYVDTPCKLIENGRFDSLFLKETIGFDKNSGRFTIKN